MPVVINSYVQTVCIYVSVQAIELPLHCRSIYNCQECRLLMELCGVLLDSGETTPRAIGVITPYKAQELLIKRELYKT